MADERDFELLDDYLTNRMAEQDRFAFERRLQADPDLQHEYALQQRLVKGIRDARVAELKSMLNQVPVSSGAGNSTATKILLGTVITIVIVGAGYWFLNSNEALPESPATTVQTPPVVEEITPESGEPGEQPTQKPEQPRERTPDATVETDKNQTSAGTEHSRPSLAKKPAPLPAPTAKSGEPDSGVNNASGLQHITTASDSRYPFHYQFADGQLTLYGPFEQGSYQVVSYGEDETAAFALYYNERYYLLSPDSVGVTALTVVTDSALLKALQDRRKSR